MISELFFWLLVLLPWMLRILFPSCRKKRQNRSGVRNPAEEIMPIHPSLRVAVELSFLFLPAMLVQTSLYLMKSLWHSGSNKLKRRCPLSSLSVVFAGSVFAVATNGDRGTSVLPKLSYTLSKRYGNFFRIPLRRQRIPALSKNNPALRF